CQREGRDALRGAVGSRAEVHFRSSITLLLASCFPWPSTTRSKFLVGAGSRDQSYCLRHSILADRQIGLDRFAAAQARDWQTEGSERRGSEHDADNSVVIEAAGIVGIR